MELEERWLLQSLLERVAALESEVRGLRARQPEPDWSQYVHKGGE